jgi:histidine triad (HIT) family protein
MIDDTCIFCKIGAGTLPSIKVAEDDKTLSFMDIMPQSPGHVLIIPKTHGAMLWDIPADAAAELMRQGQRVASAVQRAFDAPGIMVMQLNGAAAGQTVFHVHLHVIPRFGGLDLKLHAREKADPAELAKLAERIRVAL